ncbi:hypothetical protein YC2023_109311 [Brassica napus]
MHQPEIEPGSVPWQEYKCKLHTFSLFFPTPSRGHTLIVKMIQVLPTFKIAFFPLLCSVKNTTIE